MVDRGSRGFGLSLIYRGLDKYEEKDTGIFVARVVPGGQAARCGVRENDKIVTINGKTPRNVDDAVGVIKQAGNQIKVVVLREEDVPDIHLDGAEGGEQSMMGGERDPTWVRFATPSLLNVARGRKEPLHFSFSAAEHPRATAHLPLGLGEVVQHNVRAAAGGDAEPSAAAGAVRPVAAACAAGDEGPVAVAAVATAAGVPPAAGGVQGEAGRGREDPATAAGGAGRTTGGHEAARATAALHVCEGHREGHYRQHRLQQLRPQRARRQGTPGHTGQCKRPNKSNSPSTSA